MCNNVFSGQKPVIPERVYFTLVNLNYNSAGKDIYNYNLNTRDYRVSP